MYKGPNTKTFIKEINRIVLKYSYGIKICDSVINYVLEKEKNTEQL